MLHSEVFANHNKSSAENMQVMRISLLVDDFGSFSHLLKNQTTVAAPTEMFHWGTFEVFSL